MKHRALLLISIFAALNSGNVLAQEISGNFWVNPQTGQTEQLDFNLPNAGAQTQAQRSGSLADMGWTQLAMLQGGDTLWVDPGNRHELRGWIYFTAKRLKDFGGGRMAATNGRYKASCVNFDLQQQNSEDPSGGFIQIPIAPGTVGEALYDWACPI